MFGKRLADGTETGGNMELVRLAFPGASIPRATSTSPPK